MVIKFIKEVELKGFQYKRTNNILVANSLLHKIGRIYTCNDGGNYRQRKTETIYYPFVQCERWIQSMALELFFFSD